MMKMHFFNILSSLLLMYVIIAAFLYITQRNFIYFPTPKTSSPNIEATIFSSDSESLRVWVVNPDKPNAILYFGGNAEAVENNIPEFTTLFPQYSIYLVNYRGYGGSSGKPTESGNYRDALNIYQQLSPHHDSISVIGRSLGSGVASYLAANGSIQRLVLITPFDSIQKVAQSSFPIFPISLLLKDKYDSLSRVNSIDAPTLILIAEHDEVIAAARSNRLVSAFPITQVTVKVIAGASHNSISSYPQYSAMLRAFFDTSLPEK